MPFGRRDDPDDHQAAQPVPATFGIGETDVEPDPIHPLVHVVDSKRSRSVQRACPVHHASVDREIVEADSPASEPKSASEELTYRCVSLPRFGGHVVSVVM